MLDVLSPLITESDAVSTELLNIILMNIVEPNKTQRKNAYQLATELIIKTSSTLEPYIQNVSKPPLIHNCIIKSTVIKISNCINIQNNITSYKNNND